MITRIVPINQLHPQLSVPHEVEDFLIPEETRGFRKNFLNKNHTATAKMIKTKMFCIKKFILFSMLYKITKTYFNQPYFKI